MARLPITDVQGLIPLIDPRRIQEPYVVNGQNFFVDADGPVSGFSRDIIIEDPFAYGDGAQSLRVNEDAEAFYFTQDGIYQWCSCTRSMFQHYSFGQVLQSINRWTKALCGGLEYYACRGIGLLQRDPRTDSWKQVAGASVPNGIVACTQSAGRLIVLADGIVAWSAIDDGTDFVASTDTGAGFQSLSIIGITNENQLLTIAEYELGFIAYTTRGVVRWERVESGPLPFRYTILSRTRKPINQWCFLEIEDYTHLYLDRTGFFQTQGAQPEIWQPLWSEHLNRNVLGTLNLSLDTILRLFTNGERQWVFLSIADQSLPTLYNRAWALYLPSDKLGSFNRPHKAILDIHFDPDSANTPQRGFGVGFLDVNDDLWQFTFETVDFGIPVERHPFVVDWRAPREWPSRSVDGVTRFTSAVKLTSEGFAPLMVPPGYWDTRFVFASARSPDSNDLTERECSMSGGVYCFSSSAAPVGIFRRVRLAQAARNQQGLQSYVEVGVFRGGRDQAVDELTEINELQVNMLAGSVNDEFEDYTLDYQDDVIVDWATIAEGTEDEDWGFQVAGFSEYQLSVRGTLDADKTWENQQATPELSRQDGGTKFFSTQVTGLNHLIRFDAQEAGETYHLKTLELNVIPAGRLT